MIPSPFDHISSPHFNENDPIIFVTVPSDTGRPSDVMNSEKSERVPLSRAKADKAESLIVSRNTFKQR